MNENKGKKKKRWPNIKIAGGLLSASRMSLLAYIYKGLEGPVDGPVPSGGVKFEPSGASRVVWGNADEVLEFLKSTELANQATCRFKYIPQDNVIHVLFGYKKVGEFSTRKPVSKEWLPVLKLVADSMEEVPNEDKIRMFNSYPPPKKKSVEKKPIDTPKQNDPVAAPRPIEVLALSERTKKALEDADIVTVEGLLELLQKGDNVVLALDNVGERSLEEIKGTLASLDSQSEDGN